MRSHPNCIASIATISPAKRRSSIPFTLCRLCLTNLPLASKQFAHIQQTNAMKLRNHSDNDVGQLAKTICSIFKRFFFCRHLAVRRVRVSVPRPPFQYITFNFFTLFRSAHVFSSACCVFVHYVGRTVPEVTCRTSNSSTINSYIDFLFFSRGFRLFPVHANVVATAVTIFHSHASPERIGVRERNNSFGFYQSICNENHTRITGICVHLPRVAHRWIQSDRRIY